jgi:hypothetical protein
MAVLVLFAVAIAVTFLQKPYVSAVPCAERRQGFVRVESHAIRPWRPSAPARCRSKDAREECWHVYHGDVRAGSIAVRSGLEGDHEEFIDWAGIKVETPLVLKAYLPGKPWESCKWIRSKNTLFRQP